VEEDSRSVLPKKEQDCTSKLGGRTNGQRLEGLGEVYEGCNIPIKDAGLG